VISTRRLASAVATAAVLLLVGRPAFAQPHNQKIDRSLRSSLASGAATQKVIVTVDDPALRAQIRKALVNHGDLVTADHPLVHAFAAEVHSEDVEVLAAHRGVRAISADAAVSARDLSSTILNSLKTPPPGGVRAILGLPSLWSPSAPTGQGVGIALIDSGISPSYDIRVSAFYDFTRGGIPSKPYDDYGHGTFIAGLIASSGVLSGGQYPGIAPAVRLVGLKVLDGTGQGTTSDVIKAIEYVTANHDRLQVQIVNLSLGHPIFARAKDDPLVQAVEQASRAGLIVVVAAGNNGRNATTGLVGYAGINSPANAPSAISVGSVTTHDTLTFDDDRVADYSSRGPTWYDGYAKPDVVAPGTMLVSDANVSSFLYQRLVGNRVTAKNGAQMLQLSGTSMAAGVASGVAALVIESNQQAGYRSSVMTPNLVKAILQYSAIPLHDANGVAYDVLTQGAGAVNALGAIALSNAIDTSARAGSLWLRNSVPTATLLGGQMFTWSQNIVWGDNVVWGDLLYRSLSTWSLNVVWGDNIVWADNVAWGSNIVWSDVAHVSASNIVWGNNVVWGSNIVWGDLLVGLSDGDNVVWGSSSDGDNIVWGSVTRDNVVWGSLNDDNIVWGSTDNIVWSSAVGGSEEGAL
jgi:serine protease AprX